MGMESYPIKETLSEENQFEVNLKHNETGHLQSEKGRDTDPSKKGNSWSKRFENTKQGEIASEVGEITEGPDKGHEWRTEFSKLVLDDGTKVFTETGVILEQGQNPLKEPKGHAWVKIHMIKKGITMEGGKITDGPEKGRTWGRWDEIRSVEK
jgi:hypothetical protein